MGTDVRQIARDYIQTIWNEGRLDRLDDFVDPGFIDHESTFPFAARGSEGLRKVLLFFRTAFPDLHWTIEDLVSEGSKVVLRFTVRATHRGSVLGLPGTGKRVTITGVAILDWQGGRMVEAWTQWDTLGLLQQIGAADLTDSRPVAPAP